jgi:hypothetical protein
MSLGMLMRLLPRLMLILPLVFIGVDLHAADAATESNSTHNQVELVIIDPYIEVHSGPGRGYPIFYVGEWGEQVTLLTRRPDWYEVKLQNGKIGWTHASQISRTIQTTGEPADLPTVSYGDYLKNRWRTGFSVGSFMKGELESSELFSFTLGYRPFSWLGAEIEYGEFYGSDVQGNLRSFNLVIEPFSEWKMSPILLLGRGVMAIDTQPKLVPLNIKDSDFNQYGLGFNYYIGRNFIFNGLYRTYEVSTENDDERLDAWTFGFNTFF